MGVEEGVRERPGHITCCFPPSGAVKEPVQDEFQSCFESGERRRVGERKVYSYNTNKKCLKATKGPFGPGTKGCIQNRFFRGKEWRITNHIQLKRGYS